MCIRDSGRQSGGEPGLGGVTIELRDANGVTVETKATSTTGYWTFEIDPTKDWKVKVLPPSGFTVTDIRVGTNPNIDSDAYTSNSVLIPAGTLGPGGVNKTLDIGLVGP